VALSEPVNARLHVFADADAECLAQLAATIWRAHYASMISAAQIDYMLAERYTPQKLGLYLNANDRWLRLLRITDELVGYCSYALTGMNSEMKIEQLYLRQEFQGKGLGKLMLRHIEEQSRILGLHTLTLQVNKLNLAAIAFYHKAGFVVREEAIFDIGNGFTMDDYVMHKALSF